MAAAATSPLQDMVAYWKPRVFKLWSAVQKADLDGLRGEELRTVNTIVLSCCSIVCFFQPAIVAGVLGGGFTSYSAAADYVRLLGVYMGATGAFAAFATTKPQMKIMLGVWGASTFVCMYISVYGSLNYAISIDFFACLFLTYLHARESGYIK